MASKTKAEIEKQIANEQARLEKLRKQLKAKEKAEAEKLRKERNHRLIVLGGIVEKYCGVIENEKAFEDYISQYANAIIRRVQPTESDSVSVPMQSDHVVSDEGGSDSIESSWY